MVETWKPIVNYEGLYEVSDLGQVRSLDRVVDYRKGPPRAFNGIVLKQRTNRPISLSGVHVALYRLEEKGFVGSELGGATASRGGRRKRFFTITALGRHTLSELRDVRNQLWAAISTPSLS